MIHIVEEMDAVVTVVCSILDHLQRQSGFGHHGVCTPCISLVQEAVCAHII